MWVAYTLCIIFIYWVSLMILITYYDDIEINTKYDFMKFMATIVFSPLVAIYFISNSVSKSIKKVIKIWANLPDE